MALQEWASLRFDPAAVRSHALVAARDLRARPWLRQTPGGDGIFGRTAFGDQANGDAAQWLVVYDEPPPDLRTGIPRQRRILFLYEPPEIKAYPTHYLNQFGFVVGPLVLPGYKGRHIRQQPALPWNYGEHRSLSWADLAADKKKTRPISVFCSDKRFTTQQSLRIAFVEKLKAAFGTTIDHYGNGFRPVGEKADGLDPYRLTITLENNVRENFWTEKLADAYLGHCLPIYAGGRVSEADFDPAARLEISVFDIDNSLRAIERWLKSVNFRKHEDSIRAQRRRVMLRHNMFAVADRIIQEHEVPSGLLAEPEPVRQSFHWAWMTNPGLWQDYKASAR